MSNFFVKYPVTEETIKALEQFPEINRRISIKAGKRSGLEIARILINAQFEKEQVLLKFLNKTIPSAGQIGERILKQTNPFELAQNLAELFLLVKLQKQFEEEAKAAESEKSKKCPDIIVEWEENIVRIEVYTPVELNGFQRFTKSIVSALNYLDIAIGFELQINIKPLPTDRIWNQEAYYYPYSIPAEPIVFEWLNEFVEEVKVWLSKPNPSLEYKKRGPGGKIQVSIRLEEMYQNPENRLISKSNSSHSTDTSLFFRVGDAEYTVKSEWGRKLKQKLIKRQCGIFSNNSLRILIVNFTMANAGWPEFIARPDVSRRIDETIRMLINPKHSEYDIVLPAQLGYFCSFGLPVWITLTKVAQFVKFFYLAGFNQLCVRNKEKEDEEQQNSLDDLIYTYNNKES